MKTSVLCLCTERNRGIMRAVGIRWRGSRSLCYAHVHFEVMTMFCGALSQCVTLSLCSLEPFNHTRDRKLNSLCIRLLLSMFVCSMRTLWPRRRLKRLDAEPGTSKTETDHTERIWRWEGRVEASLHSVAPTVTGQICFFLILASQSQPECHPLWFCSKILSEHVIYSHQSVLYELYWCTAIHR